MGLCKCPKRRVTNQFCFEHRVNVCEHCMVTNHPRCIVQSYLQWLQDSDYNPVCELCTKELGTEDCIRLTCYHVYHWWCLDAWARNLPPNTAPAGYTCPSCQSPLFPSSNLVSPVADVLKEKLAGVNWARTGLGLPLLSKETNQPHESKPVDVEARSDRNASSENPSPQPPPHSVVHVQDVAYGISDPSHGSAPRRAISHDQRQVASTDGPRLLFDHDEDKYKRRSPSEWVSRRWKSLWSPGRGRRHWRPMVAIVAVVVFVLLLLAVIGRHTQDDADPAYDLRQNPHVHNSRRR